MSAFAKIETGVVTDVIYGGLTARPSGQGYIPAPPDVQVGWLYDGALFTDAQGAPPQPFYGKPELEEKPSYLLTGFQWVDRFTDTEWAWMKTQRASSTKLDRLMDAIQFTNSVDVSSHAMNGFYDWLLNNGLPGGQARIDELRQPL